MQIIKIIAVTAAIIICAILALVALCVLAFGIAADYMAWQDGWTDNGEREKKRKERREHEKL